MAKKKICIDESQTQRLMTDTAKLAKGIDEDICPTVREMYEENVPRDLRMKGKSKTKKTKDSLDKIGDAVNKKVLRKAGSWLDGLF